MDIEKDFHTEVAYLKAQMKTVREDVSELKQEQRELMRFMHNIQGGQRWFFGMLAVAGAIGGFISSIPKVFFNQ